MSLRDLPILNGQPGRPCPKSDRLAESVADRRAQERLDLAWAKAVKTRDHWTCQICGVKVEQTIAFTPTRAEAHHIYAKGAHPELRHEIDNGILLCLQCHRTAQKDRTVIPPVILGRAELCYRRIVLGETHPDRSLA